jgi:hypothetical protein
VSFGGRDTLGVQAKRLQEGRVVIGRQPRFLVGFCAVSVLVCAAMMAASGVAAAWQKSPPRRSKLSSSPADYFPATINGQKVVVDPRSSVAHTDPSCEIPPEGAVINPLDSPGDAVLEAIGGVWDCGSGVPDGTGFVAGIDATKAVPTVPKLSTKSLYAPPIAADAGSVKTTTVKVNGKRLKVFTYRTTAPSGTPVAGTVFETASAEPHAHLLISATTPSGTNAVPYLTAMLNAGAGKAPRAA